MKWKKEGENIVNLESGPYPEQQEILHLRVRQP